MKRASGTAEVYNFAMSKKTVYLETSFVSYLTARPSRDLITAGHQAITHAWWETRRQEFELFISEVVIDEAKYGHPEAAEKRLTSLAGINLLDVTDEAIEFADRLIQNHAIPQKAATDALHISIACVSGINYLVTWNCKHIANAERYEAVNRICIENGYVAPIICTPEELLGEYHELE